MSTVSAPLTHGEADSDWRPDRGMVAMVSFILAESALFTIFVIAYVYYIGRSLSGPTPRKVLDIPVFITICLWSSSLTIWLAERAFKRGAMRVFSGWWALTIALGAIFLAGTGREWHTLICRDHLTISTNLFGTTFYSLVGLHASHVVVGLTMLSVVLVFALAGKLKPEHGHRIESLSLYWHFVDVIWVVVFTVVYVVGR